MKFPETIAASRAGGRINVARLHFLGFKSAEKYIFEGFGTIHTKDGKTWDGVGEIVSVEGGSQGSGTVASNLTLTLASQSDKLTDELVSYAMTSETEVRGRRYAQALQFMDDDFKPLDFPRFIYVGVMDRIGFQQSLDTRQLLLFVESPLVRRRTARIDIFSDRAQRRRDPTDRLLEGMSALANKTVNWPKY